MNADKYQHELEVHFAIRNFKNKFNDIGLDVDTRFLDHFAFCPRCKNELKVYNNTLKGLASVSCYLLLEQNKAIVYGVCKKCAKGLFNSIEQNSNGNDTENNIVFAIPDLKRTRETTKEDTALEMAILQRL